MTKKPKLKRPKCPQCKSNHDVDTDYHECPSCSCGDIFYCSKCFCQFDKNGEEF